MVEDKIVPEMTAEVEKHFGFQKDPIPPEQEKATPDGKHYSMSAEGAMFFGKLSVI
jgi:hypothetical protein